MDSDGKIYIGDLNKVDLLKALWDNAKPAAFYGFSGRAAPSLDEASATAAVSKYIDYFCGRCIKSDLSKDYAGTWGYDRDYGSGSFACIVNKVRQCAKEQ